MTERKKWNELKEILPKEYFVERVERSRKERPEVCLIVVREVVDPVLARSSDPERAELHITRTSYTKEVKENKTVVEKNLATEGTSNTKESIEIVRARINGEKFTSAERLTGLNLCRLLNKTEEKSWNIISPKYLYNEIVGGLTDGINPDTVTYGAAGVESGDTFSIKSRVIEGYTYTLEPYNLLNKEQHNALYETGTMIKVGGEEDSAEEHGRGFYTHVNIEPPAKMVHFIRIESPTKEMFLYVLHNILNTTTYFARSTRKGSIRNSIAGVIFSQAAIGLSSGELIKEQFNTEVPKNEYSSIEVLRKLKQYVDNHKNNLWKILWNEQDSPEFKENIAPFLEIANLKEGSGKEILQECLVELTAQSKESYKKIEKPKVTPKTKSTKQNPETPA
jgi:CRISPR-associated protein Csc2